MDPVVRKIRPEEAEAFRRSVMVPFLNPFAGDEDQVSDFEQWAAKLESERTWVVDDGGRFAGNCCVYSLDVTVPGPSGHPCPVVPMAGVSAVGVHPTHRRRGLLTQLMATMHEDARRRGEPVGGLVASESIIYGRFGYGLAADFTEYTIDTRASASAVPAPRIDMALVDKDEALKILPEIFDRQRRSRAGEANRSPEVWAQVLADKPHHRGGALARFHVVCEDGYALYRAHDADVLRGERCKIVVDELRGVTPDIEAALWRFILDLDLVGRVDVKRAPVDDPIRFRLADPRQLRTVSVDDHLWIRVFDVPAAFEARGYQAEGRLVFEVVPPRVEEGDADGAPGRWVLETGPDGASCRRARTGEEADLRMGVSALGSLYLGGFAASQLAASGLIEVVTPASLAVADAMLTTRPAPRSGTGF